MSTEQTFNVYPTCYLEIWKALIIPTPMKLYNERVSSVLAAMQEFNLVKITEDGILIRNEFPNNDFMDQIEKTN